VWEEARRELAAIIEGTEYNPVETEKPYEPEQAEESTEVFSLTETEIAIIAIPITVIIIVVAFWAIKRRQ